MKGRKRKNDISLEQHQDVVAYYTVLKKTLDEIARAYGVTPYVVKKILTENNVTLRKRGPQGNNSDGEGQGSGPSEVSDTLSTGEVDGN